MLQDKPYVLGSPLYLQVKFNDFAEGSLLSLKETLVRGAIHPLRDSSENLLCALRLGWGPRALPAPVGGFLLSEPLPVYIDRDKLKVWINMSRESLAQIEQQGGREILSLFSPRRVPVLHYIRQNLHDSTTWVALGQGLNAS